MSKIRIGLIGSVVLALTAITAGGATAASGRGTAAANVTLLEVSLGNLQNLKVLTDEGQSTLDAARLGLAGNRAYGQLSALDASGLVDLKLPDPSFRAEAPGSSNVNVDPIPVSFPGAALPVTGTAVPLGAGLLASGTVDPVKIEAFHDGAGARSLVSTQVPDLSLLQGLISVKNVNVAGVSSEAKTSGSKGDSGVLEIGEVNVLDLDGLLGALGLSLTDLNLSTLTGILDQLGLTVPTGDLGLGDLTGDGLLATLTDVSGVWATVKGTLDSVNATTSCTALTDLGVDGLLAPATGLLDTGGGLAGLGLAPDLSVLSDSCTTLDDVKAPLVASLTSTLDGLVDTIAGLTDSLFGVLEGAPLLQVSGIKLSALANATETLAGSSASTSAELGTIKVGGKEIGALDLDATVAQVNDLKNTLLGTLSGVTSVLGPQFANLIDIGIMERSASTKTEGAYNVAEASLKALRVTLTPPTDLVGALGPVTNLPVSGLLTQVGSAVPAETGLATNVLAQAMGLASLLTQPTTIVLGSINAQSDFTTSALSGGSGGPGGPETTPVSGELPRTGPANGPWFAAMAAIALAGAFGVTRVLRKSPIDIQ